MEAVMVTFIMCQLDWAMVPRHFVKRYSECFCECVFWMSLTFKSVDSE